MHGLRTPPHPWTTRHSIPIANRVAFSYRACRSTAVEWGSTSGSRTTLAQHTSDSALGVVNSPFRGRTRRPARPPSAATWRHPLSVQFAITDSTRSTSLSNATGTFDKGNPANRGVLDPFSLSGASSNRAQRATLVLTTAQRSSATSAGAITPTPGLTTPNVASSQTASNLLRLLLPRLWLHLLQRLLTCPLGLRQQPSLSKRRSTRPFRNLSVAPTAEQAVA